MRRKLKKAEDADRFLMPYVKAVKENFPAKTGRYTAYTSNRGDFTVASASNILEKSYSLPKGLIGFGEIS